MLISFILINAGVNSNQQNASCFPPSHHPAFFPQFFLFSQFRLCARMYEIWNMLMFLIA